ncbi:MAG: hypothetical protein ACYCU0_01695 [Solirubrobacteraceae bacterium]
MSENYNHLVGHRFPGATYTLPEWLCWLWSDTAELPADERSAHPALAYFVAMQGTGVSIQEIFDLIGAGVDSGVMFGECELTWHRLLLPGGTYECEAEIVGMVRKEGRRAGVFDMMSFKVSMRESGAAELAAECVNSWVVPRKSGEG